MDCSTGGVTVTVVAPATDPIVAVTSVAPGARAAATPLPVMLATPLLADDQLTNAERSRDVPSEYLPVAVNWIDCGTEMLGLAGVTTIVSNTAGVTVSVVLPETRFSFAVMSDVPAAMAVAVPDVPMLATADVAEDHVTASVMSRDVPSEYAPVAVNFAVLGTAILGLAGVTAIDVNVAAGAVLPPPPAPPHALKSTRISIRRLRIARPNVWVNSLIQTSKTGG